VQVELVDFISVPTRNAARAVAWYRDVLGLPDSDATEGEVETPNVTLSFWEPERENLPFVANEAGFALRVADVATARAELEAKGVEFVGDLGFRCLPLRGVPRSRWQHLDPPPTLRAPASQLTVANCGLPR
jgi:catechol 2,3-dioxygenase-like lactoylglutathione lyase family enzyme